MTVTDSSSSQKRKFGLGTATRAASRTGVSSLNQSRQNSKTNISGNIGFDWDSGNKPKGFTTEKKKTGVEVGSDLIQKSYFPVTSNFEITPEKKNPFQVKEKASASLQTFLEKDQDEVMKRITIFQQTKDTLSNKYFLLTESLSLSRIGEYNQEEPLWNILKERPLQHARNLEKTLDCRIATSRKNT